MKDSAQKFAPRAKKSTPKRVLVVDDEPLVRWAVSETLNASGYQVLEAGDAQTTLQMLLDGVTPDVILLDLHLPDSSDLRLLQAARELVPATPIILMTAFGPPEIRDEAFRLGVYCVLAKPFELGELDSVVAGAIA